MNLLLMPPAMIERSQALNRMIYLRFSNVKSTHPIEEDIGIKILKMTAKVKMSHSIHMLSIQIDAKAFDYSTTSNCPFLQAK